MSKAVSHTVKRPGRTHQDPDVQIPVPEELATGPGSPQKQADVAFYSREYPLEAQAVEKAADREWAWTQYTGEVEEYRRGHEERMEPLIQAALVSGNHEPTGTPAEGENLTEDIRRLAREMGFGEVGFTRYDRHYTFASRKRWAKYEHAICLALEQDYYQTQTLPSLEAEYAHFGTYEVQQDLCLKLAEYIRSRGYHSQVHGSNDNSAAYIPMFVAAGLGQLGANGQLLSPHFGSRARLMLVTTDAPVTYDEPADYGIQKFCQECQVCVNRCPGTRPGARQGLVAGGREEQAHLRAVPAGDGRVRGMRGMHEGLPGPAIRDEAGHGALRGDRRGPWKGHRQPGGVHAQREGLFRARQAAPLRPGLLRVPTRAER